MKFRHYISANHVRAGHFSLTESDLIGSPSSGTSNAGESPLSKTQWTNPSHDAQAAGREQPPDQPLGSGRTPDATDEQLRKTGSLATELQKLLMTLPRPWHMQFHIFSRALMGLINKLRHIS